jgi:hypothetical protein
MPKVARMLAAYIASEPRLYLVGRKVTWLESGGLTRYENGAIPVATGFCVTPANDSIRTMAQLGRFFTSLQFPHGAKHLLPCRLDPVRATWPLALYEDHVGSITTRTTTTYTDLGACPQIAAHKNGTKTTTSTEPVFYSAWIRLYLNDVLAQRAVDEKADEYAYWNSVFYASRKTLREVYGDDSH